MKVPLWLTVLALIAGITIGVLVTHYFLTRPGPQTTQGDYIKDPKFKTDTVYLPGTYIHDSIPYAIHVKPKVVVEYQPTTLLPKAKPLSWLTIGKANQYLNPILTVKSDSSGYRIIYGELSKDTIRLDFQQDNQTPHTEYVISDYSKYKYQILNNSIFAKEIPTTNTQGNIKKESIFRYDGTYLLSGYEMSEKHVSIEAQTGFNLGRLRVNGFVGVPLNQPKTNPGYGFKVGYKIF